MHIKDENKQIGIEKLLANVLKWNNNQINLRNNWEDKEVWEIVRKEDRIRIEYEENKENKNKRKTFGFL